MVDLVDSMNGAAHAPLIQAAIVHAQFETIHPFTDGNGRDRVAFYRTSVGLRSKPRTDSAVARLVEFHRAGIIQTKRIERGTTAYLAREVLDRITSAERALASTRFDTRASTPNGSVPARPQT